MAMGGGVEGLACADLAARTPIGMSHEEYFKEVEESSDIFKLTHRCLPYDSGKSESEFQNEIRKNLTYTSSWGGRPNP